MDPVMDRTSVALGVAAVAIGAAAAAACRAGVAMLAAVAVLLLGGGCSATPGAAGAGGEAVQRLHQAQQQQAAAATVDVGPEVDSAGTVWVLLEFAISHGGYTSAEHVATLRTRSMCQRAAAEVDARAQPPTVLWHAARCQPMPNPDMFPEPPPAVGAKPKARGGGV